MTDTNVATDSGSEPAPIALPEHKAGGDGPISARDAARSVIDWRNKRPEQAESAAPATPEKSEPQGEDTAPPQEATGETETQTDPAELPPLDLPRSWTKEQSEHWNSLPRTTQEYLIEQAGKDSAAVRKAQNKADEAAKASEAERQQIAHLKSQYETALPNVVSMLQQAQAQSFPEIRTFEDVQKLQAEDPLKFQEWQVHQMRLGAAQRELEAAQQRQWTESKQHLQTFREKETAKLFERVPELSDKDNLAKVMNSSQRVFDDLGFTKEEMQSLWDGDAGISLHDHRFQMLVLDGIRYRELQQNKVKAAETVREKVKGVPPVQKPGTAHGKGAAAEHQIRTLETKLDNAHGVNALRAAAALTNARRAAKR